MARQEVLGEQEFCRTPFETTQVDALALKGHAAFGQSADLSDRHEEVASFDADDGADDGRVRAVAEARDQVLDATDPAAVGIEDRTVQERGEVENFGHAMPLCSPLSLPAGHDRLLGTSVRTGGTSREM